MGTVDQKHGGRFVQPPVRRRINVVEKDCKACKYATRYDSAEPCSVCRNFDDWQPSDLYTAYLAAVERAERYRAALNCGECENGRIRTRGKGYQISEPCPACADIRKEARNE